MTEVTADDLADRVTRLEQIVARHLPGARDADAPSATESTDGSGESEASGGGMLGYRGTVDLAGPVTWNISYHADSVLGLLTEQIADVFAALGHPARVNIVRTLLRGNASVTELQDTGEFGTSGQLYHHLKILSAASIVTKLGRNAYGISPTHVVPVLIAFLTAGDIGGSL